MKYYFIILGTVCVVYYGILVCYSRRLRSTFATFWLFGGGAHLLLGCAPLPVLAYKILLLFCIPCWLVFLAVEYKIISGMVRHPEKKVDYLIVLGAQVRGTRITDSLKRRLDRAVKYMLVFPDTKIIVSGGRGPGEDITEAEAMAGYLIKKGIQKEKVHLEDRSTSTRENLRFSRIFFDPGKHRTGIVTNDFHIYRSYLIARQEGYGDIVMMPADSNPVFQLNYMVREFFGVCYVCWSGRKKDDS